MAGRGSRGRPRPGTGWRRPRKVWEQTANRALERAGRAERIDGRSLADLRDEAHRAGDLKRAAELSREPNVHLGPSRHREGSGAAVREKLLTHTRACRTVWPCRNWLIVDKLTSGAFNSSDNGMMLAPTSPSSRWSANATKHSSRWSSPVTRATAPGTRSFPIPFSPPRSSTVCSTTPQPSTSRGTAIGSEIGQEHVYEPTRRTIQPKKVFKTKPSDVYNS